MARPLAALPRRPGRPSLADWPTVAALALAFIAVTVWWLTADRRVPDFDNGRHLWLAFNVHDAWQSGNVLYPFRHFTAYPPFVHIVGALAAFVGGVREAPLVLAQNLVFVPLLAASCYGVGRRAYGPSAGVLSAVFALGTPMLISQFHVFMLDAPEAAMVAVSVWAIIASERFARPGTSALAGLLCALGMLTKATFALFVIGLVAVVLMRGGWRNWRGVLVFTAVLAVIGAPWYLEHLHELSGLTSGATGGAAAIAGNNAPGGLTPSRWSRKNFGWYGWNLVNHQLLLPLALLLVVGSVVLAIRFLRRRSQHDLTPELLVGGLVSYLGETYLTLKDPRYTLPALVYMAVLGVGWIPLMQSWRRAATVAAVAGIALTNTVAVSFGVGSDVRITLPGAPKSSGLAERQLTIYSPAGYIRGGPQKDGDVLELMRGLHARGVRVIDFDPGSANVPDFNVEGLRAFARIAGLQQPSVYDPAKLTPRDAFLVRRVLQPGDPPPCQRLRDGTGIYAALGNPVIPFRSYTLVCPERQPAVYYRPGTS